MINMVHMHFDLLYIGNDLTLWSNLIDFSKMYDITVLNMKSTKEIPLIADDFSFTVVLTDLHINYNYEGFTVSQSGLKYSYLGILIDDLDEKSINVSVSLFGSEPEKYLLLKNYQFIDALLKLKILNISEPEVSKVPIEA